MSQTPDFLHGIAASAAKAAKGIDVDYLRTQAGAAGEAIGAKAADFRDAASAAKEDITNKITELDRMLDQSITEYNNAYTLMSDKGMRLYIERQRSCDAIAMVEALVNSIANRPKSFDDDFVTIDSHRKEFVGSYEFAERELQAARQSASGAGAGIAAGASVAFMAPSAAMWVATTFGTASTGTAISALSGAAASNAALAWLGGGALASGGGGMIAGQAMLALAGPIGMTVAGVTLLSSILLFSTNRMKLNKQKSEEIDSIKKNTQKVSEIDSVLSVLLSQTEALRSSLSSTSLGCLPYFSADYNSLDDDARLRLGSLVNSTPALSKLLNKTIA